MKSHTCIAEAILVAAILALPLFAASPNKLYLLAMAYPPAPKHQTFHLILWSAQAREGSSSRIALCIFPA
ncbi:hypothetical protein [Pontibacter rugosus]|uniref:Secreted protein n=1 Tax=Pontibacter rugosus TaxID=1745966 RepID=A0ABW3SSM8_9BACT